MTNVTKYLISEVQIIPIKPHNGLIAFASFVLNNYIYLSSIGIYTKLNGSGYRLTYPTKIVGDRNIQLYHPLAKDLSQAIETAIFSKLTEVLGGSF